MCPVIVGRGSHDLLNGRRQFFSRFKSTAPCIVFFTRRNPSILHLDQAADVHGRLGMPVTRFQRVHRPGLNIPRITDRRELRRFGKIIYQTADADAICQITGTGRPLRIIGKFICHQGKEHIQFAVQRKVTLLVLDAVHQLVDHGRSRDISGCKIFVPVGEALTVRLLAEEQLVSAVNEIRGRIRLGTDSGRYKTCSRKHRRGQDHSRQPHRKTRCHISMFLHLLTSHPDIRRHASILQIRSCLQRYPITTFLVYMKHAKNK